MRLLIDTHIAVWTALKPSALTQGEHEYMARIGTQVVLSAVTIWELRLKWHTLTFSGTRKGPMDPVGMLLFAQELDWELLPLLPSHAAATLLHPLGHKDPFDELLLVQAQEEGMRLLTRDAKLAGHPLAIAGRHAG